MRTRVKICCIADPAEAAMAVAAGADAVGLVGEMPSGPGVIDDAMARHIAADVPPGVSRVLLTSRRTARAIAEHAVYCGVDTVQIVAPIDPVEAAGLAALLPGVRLMQVIHVEDETAPDMVERYAGHVHAFLLDSGRPRAGIPELGGTGRTHDWDVSAAIVRRSPKPVFLAGGLTPQNVADAVRRVRPYGVDVCSGLRVNGRLDPARLGAFMAAMRHVDEAILRGG
jgi:phosphoribosylanthranilate isomerase